MLTSRHALERKKYHCGGHSWRGGLFTQQLKKMSEIHILVRLLRMYFPRNWEFGSALSKFRNFGGFEHPPPSVRHWAAMLEGGPCFSPMPAEFQYQCHWGDKAAVESSPDNVTLTVQPAVGILQCRGRRKNALIIRNTFLRQDIPVVF